MTRRTGAARHYAQALFDLAVERGAIDQWLSELARLAEVASDPEAARLLAAPSADRQAKRRALDAAAGPFSPEVGRLLDILLERKRVELLPLLAESFADLSRAHRGIARADVITAVPLQAEERALLAQRLGRYLGKAVEIEAAVDPSILGGVIARVGDQLIEASVRGRLERLRRALRAAV